MDSHSAPAIWKLWRLAALDSDHAGCISSNHNLSLCSNASSLALSSAAKDINSTSFAQGHKAARIELGLNSDFDRAGPAARIRLLERALSNPDSLNEFLNTGDQVNMLRKVRGSLMSAASCGTALGFLLRPSRSTILSPDAHAGSPMGRSVQTWSHFWRLCRSPCQGLSAPKHRPNMV